MQKLIIHEQAKSLDEPIMIDPGRMVEVEERSGQFMVDGVNVCDRRLTYEFAHKAFYLNGQFDWVLGMDSDGVICLVPLEKS